tara:strand:+ start:201 stop:521 length:321 start_codon:yes stop_codon:yes gene_type:complete
MVERGGVLSGVIFVEIRSELINLANVTLIKVEHTDIIELAHPWRLIIHFNSGKRIRAGYADKKSLNHDRRIIMRAIRGSSPFHQGSVSQLSSQLLDDEEGNTNGSE